MCRTTAWRSSNCFPPRLACWVPRITPCVSFARTSWTSNCGGPSSDCICCWRTPTAFSLPAWSPANWVWPAMWMTTSSECIPRNATMSPLFGAFPGANGAATGVSHGKEVPLVRAPQWMPGDLPHDYPASLRHINAGKMDGFAEDSTVPVSQAFAYSQYLEEDLPNYWHWAR